MGRQPLTLENIEALGFKLSCPLGPSAFNMNAELRVVDSYGWVNNIKLTRNISTLHSWALYPEHNMGFKLFEYLDEIVPLINTFRK